jgi:hypothetical protein
MKSIPFSWRQISAIVVCFLLPVCVIVWLTMSDPALAQPPEEQSPAPQLDLSESPLRQSTQYITVTMYELDDTTDQPITSDDYPNGVPCEVKDVAPYGCAHNYGPFPPPGGTLVNGKLVIDLESYARDVLAAELGYDTPALLEAQKAVAVAIRNFALFRYKWFGGLNNSINAQVYIPGLSEGRASVAQAVADTAGVRLEYTLTELPWNPDVLGAHSRDHSESTTVAGDYPYLKAIYDPDGRGGGTGVGLSQMGACRWATGNQNPLADEGCSWTSGPRPQWDHYEQILAHYYTGIDIVGGERGYSPYRWNPIGATVTVLGTPFYRRFDVSVLPQNTGIYPWENNQDALTTQLLMQVGSELVPVPYYHSSPAPVNGIYPGDVPMGQIPVNLTSAASSLWPIAPAYYLRLDMTHNGMPFSRYPMGLPSWYSYDIPIPRIDLELFSSNGCFGAKKVLASAVLPHQGNFDLIYTINGENGSIPISTSANNLQLADVPPGVPVHYQVKLVKRGETLPSYADEGTLSNLADYCDDNAFGPGGDHPDDNYSAASSIIPQATFSELPVGTRIPARVAILQRGSAHNLWWLLFQLGELATFLDVDFDPVATAQAYPVLLIPSGGLYGLESSPAFRARLEEYARHGGVIAAFAQQRGYEYTALPGGQVGGYGWAEDISCFQAALRMESWHPILAGFDRDTLTVHVDGYFTTLPAPACAGRDAQALLSRTANGMPAATLWGYAVTFYADGVPVWSLFIETLSIAPA